MSGGQALLRLVDVMDRLRSPGGCPWDAEQTHASLVQYLVEETYEAIEAIDAGDRDAIVEELGDLLLQVVFHARIGQEDPAGFDIDDVANGIVDKLIARHPHVFADAELDTAADVEAAWFERKRQEKGRTSATDGVPMGLPTLPLMDKLLHRAEKAGVGLPDPDPRAGQWLEEQDFGRIVLALSAAARARGVDLDASARAAAHELRDQIRATEAMQPPGGVG